MRLVSFTLSGLLAFVSLAGADEYTPAVTKVATSTVAKVSAPAAVVPKAAVIGADYRFGAENFGYFVVDLADGRMVAELNADEPFMPASVCKVPTMGASTFSSLIYDDEAVQKFEVIEDVPDEVSRIRQALNLDFGAIEYFVVDGDCFVIDVNKTVTQPKAWIDRFPQSGRFIDDIAVRLVEFVKAGGV